MLCLAKFDKEGFKPKRGKLERSLSNFLLIELWVLSSDSKSQISESRVEFPTFQFGLSPKNGSPFWKKGETVSISERESLDAATGVKFVAAATEDEYVVAAVGNELVAAATRDKFVFASTGNEFVAAATGEEFVAAATDDELVVATPRDAANISELVKT